LNCGLQLLGRRLVVDGALISYYLRDSVIERAFHRAFLCGGAGGIETSPYTTTTHRAEQQKSVGTSDAQTNARI
jgi:hypothetical protein